MMEMDANPNYNGIHESDGMDPRYDRLRRKYLIPNLFFR